MKIKCSWDDGSAEDMRLYDLMLEFGIEDVTFYIPSDWFAYNWDIGRVPLTPEEVRKISDKYSIGSHSITHPLLTRIPLEEAEKEIVNSKTDLSLLLNKPIDSFCYPRGYANDDIRTIVGQHYKTARNTLVGCVTHSEDPVWQSTTVHAGGKRRKEYEGKRWLEEGYRLLEEAIRTPNSIYHIFGHSWELTREDGWYDLRSLLKEVNKATKNGR